MNYAREFGKKLIDQTAATGKPMTEKQARNFAMLVLIPEGADLSPLKEAMEHDLIYLIISSRLALFLSEVEVDLKALMWLIGLSCGNPGNAVMLTTVLAYLANESDNKITMEGLVKVFPFAVPTKEVFGLLWGTQKCAAKFPASDNKLDASESWA